MSGITSNTGIFSGIDTQSLIQQLLQIEARPKQLAQRRLLSLQSQQSAYLDINSALLGLRTAASDFRAQNVFQASKATSSNPSILTASAGSNAAAGTYNISVDRLVTTEQYVSRGFADRDISGLNAGSFSFEVGGGGLTSETQLDSLNGGEGIERGEIRITDSTGASKTIDLSRAVSVDDILDAINGATGIEVTASVRDQGLIVRDNAGGSIEIENVFGSQTATSLGLAGVSAPGEDFIASGSLLYLTETTALSELNDGNGVAIRDGSRDFEITDRSGTRWNIDLGEVREDGEVVQTRVTTLQGLIDRIDEETEGNVSLSINAEGTGLTLTDNTGATDSDLLVEAFNNRSTASDLGLLGSSSTPTLDGSRLLAGINTTLASNLNGGSGISAGQFQVTRRDGVAFDVDIDEGATVNDILDAINNAAGNTGAEKVTASLNDTGNGITLRDETTGGDLIVSDLSGTAAADLGIASGGASEGVIDSGNLQAQWISESTRLSTLRAGEGVGTGQFRITDAKGKTTLIDVDEDVKTLADLVSLINSRPVDINARINDTGDGLLIEDTATGGTSALKIEDVSGSVAKNLNILGEAEWETGDPVADNVLDGTFETTVEFDPTDTLEDIADKINSAGAGVDAAIINSGGGSNPFRLSLTSETSGSVGRFIVDTGGFDLGLSQLTRGRDAVAFFGSGEGIAITSSTNTLDNVIPGVTIDLESASDEAVEVTVQRDTSRVEDSISSFVEAFNRVFDRLDFHERFDQETGERGQLLGDSTVSNLRRTLLRTVQGTPKGVDAQFDRLFQAGISVGEGSRLEFDREQFRSALEEDPAGVRDLFAAFEIEDTGPDVVIEGEDGEPLVTTPNDDTTHSRLGVMEQLKLLAEGLTNSFDGLLTRRGDTLDSQIELQERRIDRFDEQLDRKRVRLERQFLAMEQALASLQSQQNALSALQG